MSKQTYIRQDPITHILTRPDMYVGSKSFEPESVYVWENKKIVKKTISVSRALTRTFIEILSNAIDNLADSIKMNRKMTYIKVELGPKGCKIVNDGAVIPIVVHSSEKMYNHSLIFGHLLSGSNYDDTEQREKAGRNGLGAKLTNVLSTEFTVEGVDPESGQKLVQTWRNNMRQTDGPVVTSSKLKGGYTSIKWSWDCEWFKKGMKELDQDTIDMFSMLVVNAAMVTGLTVSLNGQKVPNKLSNYFSLFSDIDEDSLKHMLKLRDEQSQVFVIPSANREFEAISFVNGVPTKHGGKHVTAWVEAVCRPVVDKLKNGITLKDVKPFFRFLVVSKVPNPEFDGQEKNELTNPSLKVEHINKFNMTKITNWAVWSEISNLSAMRDNKKLAKSLAAKSYNIDGYSKANNAGGKYSKDCSLIICEGMSAKTFAIEGISHELDDVVHKGETIHMSGRDWFGVYPLRGKLLNTRNASTSAISANKVITNLMKILGLSPAAPDNLENMNYGRIFILTDADVDGIHIEGLLLNFFHSKFPSLLSNSMVYSMKTPILRVTMASTPRGTGGEGPKFVKYYFDEQSFKNARVPKNAKVKYLKGLGSNTSEDIKQVFGKKILTFVLDENTDECMKSAFDKNDSSKRKKWLEEYRPLNVARKTIDQETARFIPFGISKHLNEELIKFFYDDCKRSIPSAMDGLKESQRKIVYAAKKRNFTNILKVAQLGAYVAENTNYHHGEVNLFKTIVKMAQGYPGSNNLPLLTSEGQFGTRSQGGEDAADPRYIFTRPSAFFSVLFPSQDDHLLNYRYDDGDRIEPHHYMPVIPMILVNGCIGIGTGWMCNVPQFNPRDVLRLSRLWMEQRHEELHEAIESVVPWYRGFEGEVIKSGASKFQTVGTYEVLKVKNKTLIKVTELPIGVWTDKFEKDMAEWEQEGLILHLKNYSGTKTVHVEFQPTDAFDYASFDKKMSSGLNLDNIVVFDKDEKLVQAGLYDIINMWGEARLELNKKRKDKQIKDLLLKIKLIDYRVEFIKLVRNKILILTDDEDTLIDIMKQNIKGISDEEIETLRNLPNRLLTENESNKLSSKKSEIQNEVDALSRKTTRDMWKEDVAAFEKFL